MKHWPIPPASLAHTHLRRALECRMGDAQCINERCTPWASVTFSGSRHTWSWDWASNADSVPPPWIASLSDEEFDLPGSIVADIAATWQGTGDQRVLMIEALTVEAG